MKLKDKLIIHNYTDMSDTDVLYYIMAVVKQGKLSKTSGGEQYCFVITFKEGITIYCKRRNNTYTFKVIRSEGRIE